MPDFIEPVNQTDADQSGSRVLKAGELVHDRFEVLSLLGEGGMGVIYKVRDVHVDRVVALKMLHPHLNLDQHTLLRFQREAQTVARLDHPNIVKMLEFSFSAEGTPYIVMEYVQGESLESVLASEGTLSAERIQFIAARICLALEHAHERNILHRDIKPSNILIETCSTGENVRLLDFGMAKLLDTRQELTQAGLVFGTPLYMSPEQCDGRRCDRTSDLYSLGCCIYEMLTGTPPFVGSTPLQTLRMHSQEKPFQITLARDDLLNVELWEQIVFKTLEKLPEHRYKNAHELRCALEALSSTDAKILNPPQPEHAPSGAKDQEERTKPEHAISLKLIGAAAVAASVLIIAAMGVHWNDHRDDHRDDHSTPHSAGVEYNNLIPAVQQYEEHYCAAQSALDRGHYQSADIEQDRCFQIILPHVPEHDRPKYKSRIVCDMVDSALMQGDQTKARDWIGSLRGFYQTNPSDYQRKIAKADTRVLEELERIRQGQFDQSRAAQFSEFYTNVLSPLIEEARYMAPERLQKLLTHVVSVEDHVPGKDRPDYLRSAQELGNLSVQCDRRAEARAAFLRVFEQLLVQLKQEPVELISLAQQQQRFFLQTCDFDQARALTRASEIAVNNIPHAQLSSVPVLISHGRVLNMKAKLASHEGDISVAEKNYKESLKYFKQAHDPVEFYETAAALSVAYLRANQRRTAATELAHTVVSMEADIRRNDLDLAEALKLLSYCAESTGLPNDGKHTKYQLGRQIANDPYDFRGAGKFLLRRAKAIKARFMLVNQIL